LPDVFISPLIDFLNHKDISNLGVDLFHSKLHLSNSKIYMYQHNFDFLILEKEMEENLEQDGES
jgi:hypothetical protein